MSASKKQKDFKIIEHGEVLHVEDSVNVLLSEGYSIINAMSVYDMGKKYHVVFMVK